MKKILFAAAEAVPFVKTGGLADVVGSLPKYFPKKNYDVRVVLPKYRFLAETYRSRMERVGVCSVYFHKKNQYAGIDRLVEDGVTFYFIDSETYFVGDAPYGELERDAEKFAFFSMTVVAMLESIKFQPDIIHCHDWHTGLVPAFLEAFCRGEKFYHDVCFVYTIHNLAYQGGRPIDEFRPLTKLPDAYFTEELLVKDGEVNPLKGGIVFSDYVTTVSETYAREIQTPERGEELDELLRARSDHLVGILNGLDYQDQDPETDPRIAHRFTGDLIGYKSANKADLQRELRLDEREEIFLIGMVSRLTDQKGFDLVEPILDEILSSGEVQLAVLGTGEEQYETMFRNYAEKYPGRISANIGYSEELAQRIYASCDAFLMPSLFEPCGLSQLMALRYGTVPLVHKTGGLADTVEPYDESEHTGTGFCFPDCEADEVRDMICRARKVFVESPEEWKGIIERGMAADFSWNASCEKYAALYDRVIKEAAARRAQEKADAAREKKAARKAEKAARKDQ